MREPERHFVALIRIVRRLRHLFIELTGLLIAVAVLVTVVSALIR